MVRWVSIVVFSSVTRELSVAAAESFCAEVLETHKPLLSVKSNKPARCSKTNAFESATLHLNRVHFFYNL